jgi:hypothetical protein
MRYEIVKSEVLAESTPLHGAVMVVVVQDGDTFAAVTIDGRNNQVTAGSRTCSPAWSDRAVDYVATWTTKAAAMRTFYQHAHRPLV